MANDFLPKCYSQAARKIVWNLNLVQRNLEGSRNWQNVSNNLLSFVKSMFHCTFYIPCTMGLQSDENVQKSRSSIEGEALWVMSPAGGRGEGGLLRSSSTGYVPLAPQNPHPIIVNFWSISVDKYRPHLSHFLANVFFALKVPKTCDPILVTL